MPRPAALSSALDAARLAPAALAGRLAATGLGLGQLVAVRPPGPALGLLVAAGCVLAAVLAWRRAPVRERAPTRSLVALTAVVALAIVAPFVLGLSPPHAMGHRYLSPLWPLLALLPPLALSRLGVGARGFAVAVPVLALWAASSGASLRATRPLDAQALVAGTRGVVVDHVSGGLLLPIVWHLPEGLPVFAAPQDRLVELAPAWLEPGRPGSYVAVLRAGGTAQGRDRVLARIREACALRALDDATWWLGEAYVYCRAGASSTPVSRREASGAEWSGPGSG
jgi:hypothetical protein